jgi:DNA modification methylase
MNEKYPRLITKKISELQPASYNPRKISSDALGRLTKSLSELGNLQPITWNAKTGNIVGGHQRLKCYSALQKEEVEVWAVWLDEAQEKAANIALNKLSGEFDLPALKDILEEIDTGEIDLDITGFGADELADLMEQTKPEVEEDEIPEVPVDAITKPGDLWILGEHRVLCGDSTSEADVSRLMNGEKADMVFTDPPYGMKLNADYSGMKSEILKGGIGGKKYDNVKGDHNDFTNELISTIFSNFADVKEIFIWGADYFAELLPNKNDGSWIVWDKRANNNDNLEEDKSSDKMYGSTFELCWSKNKHKREIARVKWAGIFGMPSQDTKGRVHPTQKPIELVNWFIKKWGNELYLIADLYLGSGTTLIAAEQLGRKCYGMEINPNYCDVIVKRWENLTGKKAVLAK